MVKEIVKDIMCLSQKAEKATKEDIWVAQDLIDTLTANADKCVGLAANMIGVNKSIICVSMGFFSKVMINPKITNKKKQYEAEEGCLSLMGVRKCQRFEEIEVDYLDTEFKEHHEKFSGFIAEIIQHEVDHTEGKII